MKAYMGILVVIVILVSFSLPSCVGEEKPASSPTTEEKSTSPSGAKEEVSPEISLTVKDIFIYKSVIDSLSEFMDKEAGCNFRDEGIKTLESWLTNPKMMVGECTFPCPYPKTDPNRVQKCMYSWCPYQTEYPMPVSRCVACCRPVCQ